MPNGKWKQEDKKSSCMCRTISIYLIYCKHQTYSKVIGANNGRFSHANKNIRFGFRIFEYFRLLLGFCSNTLDCMHSYYSEIVIESQSMAKKRKLKEIHFKLKLIISNLVFLSFRRIGEIGKQALGIQWANRLK